MIQALTVWCSNNWQIKGGVAQKSNNFCPKCSDVIWHMRKEDVMKEIGAMLEVKNATTQMPGWFAARTTVIKNIRNRMSQEEVAALEAEIEAMSKKGYKEKHQKR